MTTPGSPPGGTGRMQMPGTNQLQASIDSLTRAVNNLSSRLGGGTAAGNGGWATLGSQSAGGGANGGGSSFSMAGTLNGIASGGNAGFGYSIGSAVGGALGGTAGAAAGGAIGGAGMAAGLTGGPLWATPSGLGTYNTMQWTLNQLSMGGNGAARNNLAASMYGAANPAISGFGATDASTGYGNLYFGSGSTNGTMNKLGTNMNAASAAMWAANPALTFTQRSQMAQSLYSSQSYMNLLLMGFNRSQMPVGPGGQNANPAAFLQGIGQRAFGTSGALSQSQIAGLFSQYGQGQYIAQATGVSSDVLRQMMMQYEQGRSKGMTQNQMAQMYSDLASGSKNTQAQGRTLATKAGISFSSIQNLEESKTSLTTQRSSELMPEFAAGLQTAITALNKFNESLNGKIGGSGIIGTVTGWLSRMGGLFSGSQPSSSGGAAVAAAGAGSTTSAPSSVISGAARAAVGFAEQEIGVPYVWGGESPGRGFDCSGLTQWAYKQAGVSLPRTSQQQWAALKKRSVPLSAVQAGDLVFTAGSDGTASSPGHVAMVTDPHHIIQAEMSGTKISISPYSPSGWLYAARPSGGVSGAFSGNGSASSGSSYGGTGPGMAFGGGDTSSTFGQSESDVLNGLMSGFLGNVGFASTGAAGTGPSGTSNAATSNSRSPVTNLTGSRGSVEKLMQKMAAGSPWKWSGTQWTDLYNVEMREAGFNLTAKNPTSNAYGLAQFINGPSEYYQYGGNPNTASGQITGFLNYVKSRYGTPGAAWAHEQAYNWYANGTQNASRGLAVVGDNGPEIVNFNGGEKVYNSGQMGLLGSGGGLNINVTIGTGAISIGGSGGSVSGTAVPPGTPGFTPTDIRNTAQAIGQQVAQAIANHQMIRNLQAGTS